APGRRAARRLPPGWGPAQRFGSGEDHELRRALVREACAWLPGDVNAAEVPLGRQAVVRSASVVLGLARQARGLCPSARDREKLLRISQELHELLRGLRVRPGDPDGLVRVVRESLRDEPSPGTRFEVWAVEVFRRWRELDAGSGPALTGVGQALVRLCEVVRSGSERVADRPPGLDRLLRRLRSLTGDVRAGEARVTGALVRLEVRQVLLGGSALVLEQPVELMQLSAESRNGFTCHTTPGEKLAGLQLNHFGAFYKRSWRGNDWLWGRVDAAGWLVYLLLQPARLRRLQEIFDVPGGDFVTWLTARLEEVAVCAGDPHVTDGERAWLRSRWSADKERIAAELAFLAIGRPVAGRDRDPLNLPVTSIAVARGPQYAIVREELPLLADDMDLDLREKASGRQGAAWRRRMARWNVPEPRAQDLVEQFASCPVPRERLTGELGTDRFTYTAATAVASTLKLATRAAPRLPGVLAGPLSVVRGVSVILYVLARGLLEGSKTGVALVVAAVLLGAGLVLTPYGPAMALGTLLLAGGGVAVALAAWPRIARAGRALPRLGKGVAVALAAAGLVSLPWLFPGAWAAALTAAATWLGGSPLTGTAATVAILLGVLGVSSVRRRPDRRAALEERLRRYAARRGLTLVVWVGNGTDADVRAVRRACERLIADLCRRGIRRARLALRTESGVVRITAEHDCPETTAKAGTDKAGTDKASAGEMGTDKVGAGEMGTDKVGAGGRPEVTRREVRMRRRWRTA
ncbi:DUF3376 domain-containing protein, partial [Nonomuraea rhizosphaerae]|uniref:DUF3376 domain-containing protein n=1 Tax=Nonomuraea rhizosphaerae TaxID=2665663 RepID=UPI001C5F0DAE